MAHRAHFKWGATHGGAGASMPEALRSYVGCKRERIWCLGSKIDGLKSFSWVDGRISFADCDVLIITVETLDQNTLDNLDKDEMDKLSIEISTRFSQGDLLIICIAAETIYNQPRDANSRWDNYFWCPGNVQVERIGRGATRLQDQSTTNAIARFQEYFAEIDQYEMGITQIGSSDNDQHTDAVRTKSGNIVGCVYRPRYDDSDPRKLFVILHPLKTLEESVAKVLKVLNPSNGTSAPNWIRSIKIPGTDGIVEKISALEKEIKAKHDEIQSLQSTLDDKHQYRKLAYATGFELEDVAKRALELLKFRDVKLGEPGKEDLVFTPQTPSAYSICSVEVKGIEGEIKLDNLRQLNQWVDDHLDLDIKSKGIMIVNAFRLTDIAKSRQNMIGSKNLDFAKRRSLCILPTLVLLDLCKRVLEGNPIPVEKIERTLLETEGVVTLEDMRGYA